MQTDGEEFLFRTWTCDSEEKNGNTSLEYVGIIWIFSAEWVSWVELPCSFLPDGQAPETNSSSLTGGRNYTQFSTGKDSDYEAKMGNISITFATNFVMAGYLSWVYICTRCFWYFSLHFHFRQLQSCHTHRRLPFCIVLFQVRVKYMSVDCNGESFCIIFWSGA